MIDGLGMCWHLCRRVAGEAPYPWEGPVLYQGMGTLCLCRVCPVAGLLPPQPKVSPVLSRPCTLLSCNNVKAPRNLTE